MSTPFQVIPSFFSTPRPPQDASDTVRWANDFQRATQESTRVIGDRTNAMILHGTRAQRPTADGSRRFYVATDTNTLYYDPGTWLGFIQIPDVSEMATAGDGSSGNPWTGWETTLAARTGLVRAREGFYDFTQLTLAGIGLRIQGSHEFKTQWRCTVGNAAAIVISGILNSIEWLDLTVKTGTTITSAEQLIQITNTAQQTRLSDIRFSDCWEGVHNESTAGVYMSRCVFFNNNNGGWSIHVKDANSMTLMDTSAAITHNQGFIWIEGATKAPDTILLDRCGSGIHPQSILTAQSYSNGVNTITVTDPTGIKVGILVLSSVAGIPAGTTVTIVAGNVLTISNNTTAAAVGTATLSFVPGNYQSVLLSAVSATTAPEWVEFTDCLFESPRSDDTASTSNGIQIDAGREVHFKGGYSLGGRNAGKVGTAGVFNGPGPITFEGMLMFGSLRSCFQHDADVPTSLVDCDLMDGNQSGGAFTGFSVLANSRKFKISASRVGVGVLPGGGAGNAYAYQIVAGADEFFFGDDNFFAAGGTGYANGAYPTIASAATISPKCVHIPVSGAVNISTINRPRWGDTVYLVKIAAATWQLVVGGNIAVAKNPAVGSTTLLRWDNGTALWYVL